MTADVPDVNRLAELDADIAAGVAADPGATADPASRAVLDALATTRAELAALPEVPVPPGLAARWAAAVRPAAPGPAPAAPTRPATTPTRVDETSTPNLPIEHTDGGAADAPHEVAARPRRTAGRTRRRVLRPSFLPTGGLAATEDRRFGAPTAASGRERTGPVVTPPSRAAGRRPARPAGNPVRGRRRVRPALAVGTALAGLLVVAGLLQSRPAPPGVTAADLGGVARAAVGAHDAGELADPVRRTACLRSVAPPGLDPNALLLGGRGVVLDGRPGILLVLATGQLGTFRAIVVDTACGGLLGDTVIGR